MTKKSNDRVASNEAVKSWATHRNPIIFTEIMGEKYFDPKPQVKKSFKNSEPKPKLSTK